MTEIGKDRFPAGFPTILPAWVLEVYSDSGDTIADPFGGTGTTLIAAENMDRRALLMEIDPGYCDVIVDRWERHTGEKAKR